MKSSTQVVEEYLNSGVRRQFDSNEIRLSEIGTCERKVTARLAGVKGAAHDASTLGTFEAGRYWEKWLLEAYVATGHVVVKDIEVETLYGTGHIDAMIDNEKLLEAKSIKNRMSGKLPLRSHVEQLMLYLHFWGKPNGIQYGEVAYVFKDDFSVQSFPILYDSEVASVLVKRLDRIKAAKESGTILPIPMDMSSGSFPCKWKTGQCPYWENCWNKKPWRKTPITTTPPE
jgi:hypothetical protein